ncbi:hypothetical protein DAI22_12g068701 [Oryza sativa Japonica Group]|nr:hypothetical protein DAI22_12g068701 [Oryza sativa Japonica Group]
MGRKRELARVKPIGPTTLVVFSAPPNRASRAGGGRLWSHATRRWRRAAASRRGATRGLLRSLRTTSSTEHTVLSWISWQSSKTMVRRFLNREKLLMMSAGKLLIPTTDSFTCCLGDQS